MRPDQAKQIDAIYNARVKDTESLVQQYQTEQTALEKMVTDRTVDVATLQLKIRDWDSLRLKLDESRIVMLYRIRLLLDADQYKKLNAIAERNRAAHDAGRGRGRGAGPAPKPGDEPHAPFDRFEFR